MNGNNELLTIAKYWREWADPRLIVLVLNNGDLNQVTWEMRAMEGDPEVPRLAGAARLPLCRLRRDDRPARDPRRRRRTPSAGAWDRALAADRPVVLEAITDPDVPPLPPHITLEQAQVVPMALLKGDPHEGGIVKQAIGHMFPGMTGKLGR